MTVARVALRLVPGSDPLPPAGLVARGVVVKSLARRISALADEERASLRGVITKDRSLAVIVGPAEALPWVDGLRYIGVAAPGLYVPTTRTLSVPAQLAASALRTKLPVVFLEEGLVPLASALPVTADAFAAGAHGVVGEGS